MDSGERQGVRMKTCKGFIVIMALMALAVGPAQAEMYVEMYGGLNTASSSEDPFRVTPDPGGLEGVPPFTPNYPGDIESSFEFGLKCGTWFVEGGTWGADYPDWMKNMGCYLDYSYQSLDFDSQNGTKTLQWPTGPYTYEYCADSSGEAHAVALMWAYRWGLAPDTGMPFGRWQPYVAVGPAVYFSSQHPTATSPPTGPDRKFDDFGSDSSVDFGLEAELGLRWMVRQDISLDASVKYRYAAPCYDYSVVDEYGWRHEVEMDVTYELMSFQLGAAYHF